MKTQAVDTPFHLDERELEEHIISSMDEWNVPGLAIAIIKDDETVMAKGFGYCEAGKKNAITENTLMSISAGTESFTAAAIALLVTEGALNWNDRLVDLLPGFRTGNECVTHQTTVIDALSGRTGLSSEMLSCLPHPGSSRADILSKMKYLDASQGFRSGWGSSFHMSVAVGEIIPALTGKTWDEFVRERLLTPLGMLDTVTGPQWLTDKSNVATPHDRDALTVTPMPHAQTANVGPALSMYSTAADMAKWLRFQLQNAQLKGETLLAESALVTLRQSHVAANFAFPGISRHFINKGLGHFISDSTMGHKIYSNGGDVDGWEAYHAFVPELNLGVAIMINTMIALPQPLLASVIDRYSGAPKQNWVNEILPAAFNGSEKAFAALDARREAITDSAKKPSHPITQFSGCYRHPLIGDLTITVEAAELCFTLGETYCGKLLHANHNTFFVSTQSYRYSRLLFKGPAQFHLNSEGEVSALTVVGKTFHKVLP